MTTDAAAPPDDPLDNLAHQLAQSRSLMEPPAWASHRLLALWPAVATAPAVPPLRRLLAQLADALGGSGAAGMPALGLRGEAQGWRQWVFQAEDHDIELRLRPDPQQPEGAWQLQGQVLGPDCHGRLRVTAAGADGRANEVPLDELGGFQVDGLARGPWQVQVQLADRLIDLPPLERPGEQGD